MGDGIRDFGGGSRGASYDGCPGSWEIPFRSTFTLDPAVAHGSFARSVSLNSGILV
jgi:hypothetical protein